MWQSGDSFEQRKFELRLKQLIFVFSLCVVFLVLRLFVLQIVKGSYYVRVSESNRTQLFFQRAPRGIIFDSKSRPIVDNIPKITVLFSTLNLEKDVLEDVITRLGKILKKDPAEIWNQVSQRTRESAVNKIAEDISRDELLKLEENNIHLPGVSINFEPRRRYPPNGLAAHLLGYLGEISRVELRDRVADGYRMGDIVGKQGVERVYDPFLKGEDGGFQLEVDAVGRSKRILYQIDTVKGSDVYLTIDLDIQRVLENYFIRNNYAGAAVAIDPSNGKVLAICSFPTYDPNLFAVNSPEVIDIITDTVSKPLLNRALQGQYPPASVFKIITSAAMLESQGFDTERKINCEGSFHLGGARGRTFKCWESKGHGRVDFIKGMAKSCDVYFYITGLEIGPEPIMEIASDFNLGRFTGVDLPGEERGLVPSISWKRRVFKQPWYRGDTVNMSIGQGYLLLTPIQMAVMMAATANRGLIWRPYVVDKIQDNNGKIVYENEPFLLNRINLLGSTWEMLDESLIEVVSSGTGSIARIQGIRIAGKTGTAENPHGEDHAWFGAYASLPDEKPQIAVAVFIDHGKHGSSAAAPAAREAIREYFKNYSKKVN